MLSPEIIFDDTNSFEVIKTETVFFVPKNGSDSSEEYLQWIETGYGISNRDKIIPKNKTEKSFQEKRSLGRGHHKKKHGTHKIKKYIHKLLKGKKKKKKFYKKKFMHIFLGILAAKGFLVLLVLKTIALIAAKVLIMGFFSTLMSTIVSLKGMLGHSYYGHRSRKDDGSSRLEVLHVPPKDDVYYGRPYRRKDLKDTSDKSV